MIFFSLSHIADARFSTVSTAYMAGLLFSGTATCMPNIHSVYRVAQKSKPLPIDQKIVLSCIKTSE